MDTAAANDQPPVDVPAYPIPRPASGDDPRFCFGLAWDIGKVLHEYGFPPVRTGRDVLRIQQALFTLIYQEQEEPR